MLHAHPRAAVAIPLPKRIAKDTRHAIEAAVEQHMAAIDGLVALLDAFDGDADLEPSLGRQVHGSAAVDLEADVGDEPHDAEPDDVAYTETHGRGGSRGSSDYEDHEPSLSLTNGIDQVRALCLETGPRYLAGKQDWISADADLEIEHDGREPEADREPSLGSLNCVGPIVKGAPAPGFDQGPWALGSNDDLENEFDGREPDDEEGLIAPVSPGAPLARL